MSVTEITNSNFENEVLHSDKPVLVDFWAVWCPPCKMLSPTVDAIAEETDSVKVCKINVDDCPELAARFGVANIPTLIVFKGGEEAARSVGVQSKEAILSMVQ
ncbi:MAG: thioredoxin [Oscillospiraceae bacterium]|jgi:thioredoxin 1|nr:thioredoxin [Oscillospiraceae bacterium]